MKNKELENLKIKTFTPNWYALLVCICKEKKLSVAQSCKSMGVKVKSEKPSTRSVMGILDKEEVTNLYKKLKTVRQVALNLECCEVTVSKFMDANGIIRNKKKARVSDGYDKNKIIK